jgi:hypothetical protein
VYDWAWAVSRELIKGAPARIFVAMTPLSSQYNTQTVVCSTHVVADPARQPQGAVAKGDQHKRKTSTHSPGLAWYSQYTQCTHFCCKTTLVQHIAGYARRRISDILTGATPRAYLCHKSSSPSSRRSDLVSDSKPDVHFPAPMAGMYNSDSCSAYRGVAVTCTASQAEQTIKIESSRSTKPGPAAAAQDKQGSSSMRQFPCISLAKLSAYHAVPCASTAGKARGQYLLMQ